MSLIFLDFETRSKTDLKKHGVWRYVNDPSTEILCVSYYFADNNGVYSRMQCMDAGFPPPEFSGRLSSSFVCAWNAQFDRLIWQKVAVEKYGWPQIPTDRWVCAKAQAQAYGLPGKLERAADTLKVPIRKDRRGKALIEKLGNANKPWEATEEDIKAFEEYALADTLAMKQVWDRCRKFTQAEWEDYWVLQDINDRGMLIDVEYAECVLDWAKDEHESLNKQLQEHCKDPEITLTKSPTKIAYLESLVQGTDLEKAIWKTKVNSKKIREQKKSADASVQTELKRLLESGLSCGRDKELLRFLDILEQGNGVASRKFKRILAEQVDCRLRAQYVHSGAGQTVRDAARGVNVQNIKRDELPKGLGQTHPPLDVMDCLLGEPPYDQIPRNERSSMLSEWYNIPFADVLGRTIRPSIVAPPGEWLVWGDWGGIDNRTLPWLANTPGSLKKVEEIRKGINQYEVAAKAIFGYEVRKSTHPYERFVGKVAELSLGYQGGAGDDDQKELGALRGMARSMGLHIDQKFAEKIVENWREKNSWASPFWYGLMDAAKNAIRQPSIWFKEGRLRFICSRGDLFMQLPSQQLLAFPSARLQVRTKTIKGRKREVESLTYRGLYQGNPIRKDAHGGFFAGVGTQGTANSLLRNARKKVHDAGLRITMCTHDELTIESAAPEGDSRRLKEIMETAPKWAEGLPLKAEVEFGRYYGK